MGACGKLNYLAAIKQYQDSEVLFRKIQPVFYAKVPKLAKTPLFSNISTL
ncbi:MAG: hypothetical protein ACI9F2_000770 [Lysobacterales bacterium]